MTKISLILLSILFALILCSIPAKAAPTYFGNSGLILLPDNTTTGSQAVILHFHYIDNDEPSDLIGGVRIYKGSKPRLRDLGFIGNVKSFGISYGVIENLEVGYSYVEDNKKKPYNFVHAKYVFVPPQSADEENPITLTVGANDILDELMFSPYAVISRRFPIKSSRLDIPDMNINANLGFGGGIYEKRLFGGVELGITPQISLIGELSRTTANVGARYNSGSLIIDLSLIDGRDIAAGLSYAHRFGK